MFVIEWFLQQGPLVIVWTIVAALLMLYGLWKTYCEKRLRASRQEPEEATPAAEDIHIVKTQALPYDGYVYTPGRERVGELAADVFNEECDFGNEFEGDLYESEFEEKPVPARPRRSSPRTVQPRYPTQPLPTRQQPARPVQSSRSQSSPARQRPAEPQSVRKQTARSAEPQRPKRLARSVQSQSTRSQTSPYPPRREIKPKRGDGW